jgi:hypothetical protein
MSVFLKLAPLFLLIIGCDSGTGTEKPRSSQNLAVKSSSSVQALPLSVEASSEKPSSSPGQSSSGTLLKASNIILYDKSGMIGNTVSVNFMQISMYSNKGYIYNIDWNGVLSNSGMYYSDSNCTGKAFVYSIGYYYGKTVFYNKSQDKIFIPKDTVDNGATLYIKDYLKTLSMLGQDTCYNVPNNLPMIELKPTTKKEVGIPEKITPPLRIEFE